MDNKEAWLNEIKLHHISIKKKFQPSVGHLVIVVLLCTLLIISMNFFFTQSLKTDFKQTLNSIEYEKAWGEENYKVFREIQKDEMNSFLTQMNEKDPLYMKNIKSKVDPNYQRPMKLTSDEVTVLHNEIPLSGSGNALYTAIEFSDFECEYCKKFHNESNLQTLLKDYSGAINYTYKSMPLSSHANAKTLAEYARCVYENSTQENYFSFIDFIFATETLDNPPALVEKFASEHKLSLDSLNICLKEPSTKEVLERDFGHGVYLWIKMTPSVVLLNNTTWDYTTFQEQMPKDELKNKIDSFLNQAPLK